MILTALQTAADQLAPAADTRADLDRLRALLPKAADLAAALDRVATDTTAADATLSDVTKAHADALARRALDPDGVKDADIKRARAAVVEAVAHREGLALAGERLLSDLATVEADIQDAAERAAPILCGAHAGRIVALLQARIAAIVEDGSAPLRAVAVEVAMLADALRTPTLHGWLSYLCVPGLGGPFAAPILQADAALRNAWRADPALVQAHAVSNEPQRLLADLLAYVPHARRVQLEAPARWKGYTRDGVTGDKASTTTTKPPAAPAAVDTPHIGRSALRSPRATHKAPTEPDMNRLIAMQGQGAREPVSEFTPWATGL